MKVLYLGIKRTANQVYTIKLKGEKLAREQLHNQAWNENGLLQGKSPIKDRYRCTVSNILKLQKAVDGKFKSCISKWEIYYN